MKNYLPYLLAAISGLIYASSFISLVPGLLMLIGFVPLLYADFLITESNAKRRNLSVFLVGFICFFVATALLMWPLHKLLSGWIVLFMLYNAIILAFVFVLFSITKKRLGDIWGYIAFVVYFVAFEFIYFNIRFAFPAMSIGFVSGGMGTVAFIQWYEYTGVLGGTVWILITNVLIFFLWQNYRLKKQLNKKLLTATVLTIVLPVCISLFIYYNYEEKTNPLEVVVVQPNICPYTEKFSISNNKQLDIMIELARQEITPNTRYVLFPETALDSNMWLNNISENYMVQKIRDSLLSDFPQAKVITGINMMKFYVVHDGVRPTPSARKVNENIYFDFFNAAIQIDTSENVQAYKKSKLVLGTEYVPFSNRFAIMERLSMRLGGSAQSRGTQPYPTLMSSPATKVATIICYESLFGEYVSQFVYLGAEVIFVITNDGWWDGTPVPEHHFRFSQVRAIENRRAIARSGNTGISGFIDQRGNVIEQSEWWTAKAMNNVINKNRELTFYSRHGDFIGRISLWLSGFILLFALWKKFSSMKRNKTVSKKKAKKVRK